MSSARRRSKLPSLALPGFDEAAELVAAYAARMARVRPDVECVRLDRAFGRVLAEPLRADADQPSFARSTRDGFACRAAEISAHRPLAVVGSTRAGQSPSGSLPRGSAWEIMTGAPVPPGADAVVMLEHVEEVGASSARAIRLEPSRTIRKGENIVARGAQARKGDKLLAAGTEITAAQIALAASCGSTKLDVFLKPRVAILSTGDELVSIGSSPGPSQIRNSSSAMLAAMVSAAGGDPWVLPIARDTAKSLDAALRPRRLRRSPAHHRRRLRGQIRSGRAGTHPRRSALSLHRRPHPARQAAGLWRDCHPPGHKFRPKQQPHEVLPSLGFPAIPFPPPSRSCSSPRRLWLLLRDGGRTSGPASPSRVSPKTSRRRPASHAFFPLPARLPAQRPKSRSFPGKAPAISLPWPAPIVSWSCPKTSIAFAPARLSAFCFPEESHAQTHAQQAVTPLAF